jgi:hypothetical protein
MGELLGHLVKRELAGADLILLSGVRTGTIKRSQT